MALFAGKPGPWPMCITPAGIQGLSSQIWSVSAHLDYGPCQAIEAKIYTARQLLTGESSPELEWLFGDARNQARKKLIRVLPKLIPKRGDIQSPLLMAMLLAVGDAKVVKKLRRTISRNAGWDANAFSIAAADADLTSTPTLAIDLGTAIIGDGSAPPFPLILTGAVNGQETGFIDDPKFGPRIVLPNLNGHPIATPHVALQYDPSSQALKVWRLPATNADGEVGSLTCVVDGRRAIDVGISHEFDLAAAGGEVLLRMSTKAEDGSMHEVANALLHLGQVRTGVLPKDVGAYSDEFEAKRDALLPQGTIRVGTGFSRKVLFDDLPESGIYALVKRRENPDVEGSRALKEVRFHAGKGGETPESLFLGSKVSTGEELIALGRYARTVDRMVIDGAGNQLQTHDSSITGMGSDTIDVTESAGLGTAAYDIKQLLHNTEVKVSKGWSRDSARFIRQAELGEGILIVKSVDEILAVEAEHQGRLNFVVVDVNDGGGEYGELRIAADETAKDRMVRSNRGKITREWVVSKGVWRLDDSGARFGSVEEVEDFQVTTAERWERAKVFLQDAYGIELKPEEAWRAEVDAAAERIREKLAAQQHGRERGRITRIREPGDQEIMHGQEDGKYVLVTWNDMSGTAHYELRTFYDHSERKHYQMAVDPRGYGQRAAREYVVAAGCWRFSLRSEMFHFDGGSIGFPTKPDSIRKDSGSGGVPIAKEGGGIDRAIEYLEARGIPARIKLN